MNASYLRRKIAHLEDLIAAAELRMDQVAALLARPQKEQSRRDVEVTLGELGRHLDELRSDRADTIRRLHA